MAVVYSAPAAAATTDQVGLATVGCGLIVLVVVTTGRVDQVRMEADQVDRARTVADQEGQAITRDQIVPAKEAAANNGGPAIGPITALIEFPIVIAGTIGGTTTITTSGTIGTTTGTTIGTIAIIGGTTIGGTTITGTTRTITISIAGVGPRGLP
jgi:hypothetical protein